MHDAIIERFLQAPPKNNPLAARDPPRKDQNGSHISVTSQPAILPPHGKRKEDQAIVPVVYGLHVHPNVHDPCLRKFDDDHPVVLSTLGPSGNKFTCASSYNMAFRR